MEGCEYSVTDGSLWNIIAVMLMIINNINGTLKQQVGQEPDSFIRVKAFLSSLGQNSTLMLKIYF